MIELILMLLIHGAKPVDAYAATAIATCESGDTVTFGSHVWTARSHTNDGGAYQFNDATWEWIVGEGRGDTASPSIQTGAFLELYDSGRGIGHWSASERCWRKWLTAEGLPTDNAHYSAFVGIYEYASKQVRKQEGAW